MAGLLFGFVQTFGKPWPTSPDIQHGISEASYKFPMTIKNDGLWFSMAHVKLNCLVTRSRYLNGAHGMEFEVPIENAPGRDTDIPLRTATIVPGGTINYGCDSMLDGPIGPNGAVDVSQLALITFVIKTEYDVEPSPHPWHRTDISSPFTWEKSADGSHWLEGEVIEEPFNGREIEVISPTTHKAIGVIRVK